MEKHVRFDKDTKPSSEDEDAGKADLQLSGPLAERLSEDIFTTIGPGMKAHLLRTILGPDEKDNFESIQINLSDLPFASTVPPEKSDRSAAAQMLGDTARLVLDLPDLEVDLTIRPVATSSTNDDAMASVREWVQASDFTRWISMDVPRPLLSMIGLLDSVGESEKGNEKHLAQVIAILKPSRLKLACEPLDEGSGTSKLSDISTPDFFDPTAPLLYAGRMPIVMAGNEYFTKPKQILNYLEIGPWIPVSDRCETEYGFVCSRWQIRVLAIRVVWPDKKRLIGRANKSPLPDILWDRSMGFSAMINGQTGSSCATEDEPIRTRIVLILERAKYAAKIADELNTLAENESPANSARQSEDTRTRLDALKEMVYFVCPNSSQEVKHIFSVHSKKKSREKGGKRPKKERAEEGKTIDLPPLKPDRDEKAAKVNNRQEHV